MRKSSTVAMDRIENFKDHQLTIGLDLGDRFSHYCILNEAGEVIGERNLPTTPRESRNSSAGFRAVGSR
jgi:hypothetical protein